MVYQFVYCSYFTNIYQNKTSFNKYIYMLTYDETDDSVCVKSILILKSLYIYKMYIKIGAIRNYIFFLVVSRKVLLLSNFLNNVY